MHMYMYVARTRQVWSDVIGIGVCTLIIITGYLIWRKRSVSSDDILVSQVTTGLKCDKVRCFPLTGKRNMK